MPRPGGAQARPADEQLHPVTRVGCQLQLLPPQPRPRVRPHRRADLLHALAHVSVALLALRLGGHDVTPLPLYLRRLEPVPQAHVLLPEHRLGQLAIHDQLGVRGGERGLAREQPRQHLPVVVDPDGAVVRRERRHERRHCYGR